MAGSGTQTSLLGAWLPISPICFPLCGLHSQAAPSLLVQHHQVSYRKITKKTTATIKGSWDGQITKKPLTLSRSFQNGSPSIRVAQSWNQDIGLAREAEAESVESSDCPSVCSKPKGSRLVTGTFGFHFYQLTHLKIEASNPRKVLGIGRHQT